jgi:hypothetical protein
MVPGSDGSPVCLICPMWSEPCHWVLWHWVLWHWSRGAASRATGSGRHCAAGT